MAPPGSGPPGAPGGGPTAATAGPTATAQGAAPRGPRRATISKVAARPALSEASAISARTLPSATR
eukprot:2628008-Lingulodinium_polyedra.AAC.1